MPSLLFDPDSAGNIIRNHIVCLLADASGETEIAPAVAGAIDLLVELAQGYAFAKVEAESARAAYRALRASSDFTAWETLKNELASETRWVKHYADRAKDLRAALEASQIVLEKLNNSEPLDLDELVKRVNANGQQLGRQV